MAKPTPPKLKITSTLEDETTSIQPKTDKPKSHVKPKSNHTKWIVLGGIAALLLAVAGFLVWKLYFHKTTKQADKPQNKEEQKADAGPTLVASPLTGSMVTEDIAKQPVVASVIENLNPDARPQSGLSSAGVVYETLAEGGITRYMAVFQDTYPKDLGPVRSLRPFFIDWAKEYNAPLMHVGGSALALSQVGPKGLKDLNQFYFGSYFRRISSRYAPHNVYITSEMIQKLLASKGYNAAPTFTTWNYKDDAKSAAPNAATIAIGISTPGYNPSFKYNADTNDYSRLNGGQADIDANTKAQIKVKNVIVELTSITYKLLSTDNKVNTITQTTGSGKVLIFHDGTVSIGTWSKPSTDSRTSFKDAAGATITLNRGHSWVVVAPLGTTVSYQ